MYENHIGKISEGCEIHHKDFTKNDFLDNFQVVTKGEHKSIHTKGENHPNSTLRQQDVIQIRIDLGEGILNQTEIAKKFGVCSHTISDIKTGKIWKHIK